MKTFAGMILVLSTLAGCATAPREAPREVDFTRFDRIVIDEVQLAPQVAAGMSAGDGVALAARMQAALIGALPATAVAHAPAPRVLRVRITVTDINTVSPATNAVTAALLFVPMDRGGLSFEARFYDGLQTQPMASSTQTQLGSQLDLKGSFSRYGHALDALAKWGAKLAESLPRA